jgi:solute carrier family 25 protein 39/40
MSSSNEKNPQNTVVTLRAFDHILASAIGGTLTALSVTPLDVVKVRLQAQVDPLHAKSLPARAVPLSGAAPVRFNGTIDAMLKIARLEGVASLWRGLVPTLVMTVPGVALYFTSYEKFKSELSGLGHFTPLVAGAAARTLTATITSPLELFRTNIQSHNRNISALSLAKQIVSQGKVSHLWTGLGPTLFRDVPFSSIYWGLYEFTKHQLVTKRKIDNESQMRHTMKDGSNPKVIRTFYDTFLIPFISGATAGAVAATVTVPFDVIKTRMQMDVDQHGRKTLSAFQLLRQVAQNEGIRGLMKGAVPRATRVAPACAIMISSYELFSRFLLKRKKAEEEKKLNMEGSLAVNNNTRNKT